MSQPHPHCGGLQWVRRFLRIFDLVVSLEELQGGITGVGNSGDPFGLSCCAEDGSLSLILMRLWMLAANHPAPGWGWEWGM